MPTHTVAPNGPEPPVAHHLDAGANWDWFKITPLVEGAWYELKVAVVPPSDPSAVTPELLWIPTDPPRPIGPKGGKFPAAGAEMTLRVSEKQNRDLAYTLEVVTAEDPGVTPPGPQPPPHEPPETGTSKADAIARDLFKALLPEKSPTEQELKETRDRIDRGDRNGAIRAIVGQVQPSAYTSFKRWRELRDQIFSGLLHRGYQATETSADPSGVRYGEPRNSLKPFFEDSATDGVVSLVEKILSSAEYEKR